MQVNASPVLRFAVLNGPDGLPGLEWGRYVLAGRRTGKPQSRQALVPPCILFGGF